MKRIVGKEKLILVLDSLRAVEIMSCVRASGIYCSRFVVGTCTRRAYCSELRICAVAKFCEVNSAWDWECTCAEHTESEQMRLNEMGMGYLYTLWQVFRPIYTYICNFYSVVVRSGASTSSGCTSCAGKKTQLSSVPNITPNSKFPMWYSADAIMLCCMCNSTKNVRNQMDSLLCRRELNLIIVISTWSACNALWTFVRPCGE